MDAQTRANWIKVKKALEQNGKIDTFFYKRAVAIAAGKPDLLKNF